MSKFGIRSGFTRNLTRERKLNAELEALNRKDHPKNGPFNSASKRNGRYTHYGINEFVNAAARNDIETMVDILNYHGSKQPFAYYMITKGGTGGNETALMKAANNNSVGAIYYMLDEMDKDSTDISVLNEKSGIGGETALHRAAKNGHYDAVEALVRGGADIFVEVGGKYAVDYASKNNHGRIVKYLNSEMDRLHPPRPARRGGSRKAKKTRKQSRKTRRT